jgi:hypothetical protein
LRQVVGAYLDLSQFDAASNTFREFCTSVRAALQTAADRARLLPYPSGGPGPEHTFENVLAGIPEIEQHLALLALGQIPDFELELNSEDTLHEGC